MSGAPQRVVIAGASAAGLSAADGLREGGFEGTITVLSAERHPPYDRPTVSKDLLTADSEPGILELRTAERLKANCIDLRLGQEAVGLDIDRNYVITSDGEPLPWDALVVATGTRPRRLLTDDGTPLPVLRTIEDLRIIRAAVAQYGEITLIGSGFIGLEVAAGLVQKNVKVTVFDAAPLPLEPIVGREVATSIRQLHRRHGVDMHGGATITAVSGEPGRYCIHFADGAVHQTPFVLVGIGVDPNTDWLVGSGVQLSHGVNTDQAGRTNVPGVWAAGDIALFEHPLLGSTVRVEHWTHAIEQGRHVGLNIMRDEPVPYGMPPYFWSDQYGKRFQSYGRRRPHDKAVVVHGSLDADEFLVLYGDENLHAVFACGCERSLRSYRRLIERRGTFSQALEIARVEVEGRVRVS